MKRRQIIRTLAVCALACLALTACGGKTEPQTEPATENVTDGATVTTAPATDAPAAEEREEIVLVENGKSEYMVISARAADAEITEATRAFISELEKKTGVKLKLYPESYTESECEIVVGMVHDRAAAAARMQDVGYTSWGVFVEGKKVIVTFNYRYISIMEKIKQLLDSGLVGDIYSVDFEWMLTRNMDLWEAHGASYFRRWNSRMKMSGGLLVHKSTHHFDLVNWWLGQKPKTVSAFGQLRMYGGKNYSVVCLGIEPFFNQFFQFHKPIQESLNVRFLLSED